MRSYRVFFACLLAAGAIPAQSLEDKVSAILAAPAAQRATWGIHVVELSSGRVVYSRGGGVPMTPASNTKLFTSALALARLGPDYRFETQICASASPDGQGRLAGDLVLVGGGDPALSGRIYPYRKGPNDNDPLGPLAELADAVVAAGVRVIDGDIVGDDRRWPYAPYPDGWAIADAPWEYGAAVGALVVSDSTMGLTVRPGAKAGDAAAVELKPANEQFTIYNTVRTVAGAENHVTVDRRPFSHVIELRGSIGVKSAGTGELLAVDDPAEFAAAGLAALLRARGVTLRGRVRARHRAEGTEPPAPDAGVVLARRQSPPLVELLRVVNKVSQNLHAEMMLREVALKRRGDGSVENGQKELRAMLDELHVAREGYHFEDGSGLSRLTLVSAETLTSLLAAVHASPQRDAFWSLLPVAGEDGTLAARFRGAAQASAIRAKTGSLSHVHALSGYAGLDPERRLAFSIIVNGASAPSSAIRPLIDKIAVAVLEEAGR